MVMVTFKTSDKRVITSRMGCFGSFTARQGWKYYLGGDKNSLPYSAYMTYIKYHLKPSPSLAPINYDSYQKWFDKHPFFSQFVTKVKDGYVAKKNVPLQYAISAFVVIRLIEENIFALKFKNEFKKILNEERQYSLSSLYTDEINFWVCQFIRVEYPKGNRSIRCDNSIGSHHPIKRYATIGDMARLATNTIEVKGKPFSKNPTYPANYTSCISTQGLGNIRKGDTMILDILKEGAKGFVPGSSLLTFTLTPQQLIRNIQKLINLFNQKVQEIRGEQSA